MDVLLCLTLLELHIKEVALMTTVHFSTVSIEPTARAAVQRKLIDVIALLQATWTPFHIAYLFLTNSTGYY